MGVRVHKSANERQADSPWAANNDQLQQVVARYLEGRALLKPGTGTIKQRLARAEAALRAQKPAHSETLTKLCKEYVAAKKEPNPDRDRLGSLEIEIENLDTILRITEKGAALVFAIVYLYWRANQNSVYVAQEVGIKPPHVRTLLHRLSVTWERMGNVVKRKPRRNPEELAAIRRGQEALALHKWQQREEERRKREAFAQELRAQKQQAWEAKQKLWAERRAAKAAAGVARAARKAAREVARQQRQERRAAKPVRSSRQQLIVHIEPGTRFGYLVVQGPPFIECVEKKGRTRHLYCFPCLCDCGNRKSFRGIDLRHGNVKSCGCRGRGIAPLPVPQPAAETTATEIVVPVVPAPAQPAVVWQPLAKRDCALPGCRERRQRFTTVAFERVWLCGQHMTTLENGAIQIAVKNQSVVIRELTNGQA